MICDRLETARREQTRVILQVQEDERRRIGMELHDEAGQNLTALLIHIEVLHQLPHRHPRPRPGRNLPLSGTRQSTHYRPMIVFVYRFSLVQKRGKEHRLTTMNRSYEQEERRGQATDRCFYAPERLSKAALLRRYVGSHLPFG